MIDNQLSVPPRESIHIDHEKDFLNANMIVFSSDLF